MATTETPSGESTEILYYVEVDFNPKEGSGAPDPIEESDTKPRIAVTIPLQEPTLAGYRFLYWTIAPQGTLRIYPGETWNFTGGTTAYLYILSAVYAPLIDEWSWSASNGSATAAETKRFYNVLRGNAKPENGLPYKVWNDLVDKVDELIDVCGNSWYAKNGYGKSGCKVRSGETFSAAKYNEVRYQIDSIMSTGISDRRAGDEIQGRYITALTDNINSIISSMK